MLVTYIWLTRTTHLQTQIKEYIKNKKVATSKRPPSKKTSKDIWETEQTLAAKVRDFVIDNQDPEDKVIILYFVFFKAHCNNQQITIRSPKTR